MILLLLLARSTTKCGFVVKVNNKINVESPKKQVTIAVPNSNELRFTVELGWLNQMSGPYLSYSPEFNAILWLENILFSFKQASTWSITTYVYYTF